MGRWAVGVDLGGTNLRVVEVHEDGTWGRVASEPLDIDPDASPFGQVVRMVGEALVARPDDAPAGIGLGATGPIDLVTGVIDNAHTLPPSLQGDVRSVLVEAFGLPVELENDANSAALGEAWVGAGRGAEVVAVLTVGTGIGGGVVVRGALHRGAGGTHPELGHAVVDPAGPLCYCGAHGCVESLASASAVLAAGTAAGVVPPGGSSRTVFEAAAAGNAVAADIVSAARRALGQAVRTVVSLHAPDLVVLAGNALGDTDAVLATVRAALADYPYGPAGGVRLVGAELGGLAGAVGAASLVLRPREFAA